MKMYSILIEQDSREEPPVLQALEIICITALAQFLLKPGAEM